MTEKYGGDFFKNRHQKTVYSAERILTTVLRAIPEVQSAVDFGCGVGTWLAVLQERGVSTVQGYDGPWGDPELLEIPKSSFDQVDLESPVNLDRRFDLAISLEVAEHLKPESAETFVETLTKSSDFVLFSAAIPSQGGKHHLNEQWQDYWVDLFESKGHACLDLVRTEIWDERDIPIWYRQNTLMFVKRERVGEIEVPSGKGAGLPVSVVHPEMYLSKVNQMTTFKGSLKAFRRAVRKWF